MIDPSLAMNQSIDDSRAFFGRQTEIAWLIDQLARGQRPLVIYGARRIGKSSLLRQLVHRLPDTQLAVYLDAGKARGWVSVSPLSQIAGEIGRSVRERTGVHVEPPEAAPFTDDPVGAWQTYFHALTARLDRKLLVLLIDNAERAAPEWLRVLLQARSPAVLATARRDLMAELFPEVMAAAPSTILGPLDNDAAEALTKALVTQKSQIDPWAVRRILEMTSNHPYYIWLLCRALLECCSYRSPLMPSDVKEALKFLLDTSLADFVATWESLNPREHYILSAFGALRGRGGIATEYDIQKACSRYGLSVHNVAITLNSLHQRGLLEKLGASSYRFALELFRLWVHHRHPPHEVFRQGLWRFSRSDVAGHFATLRHALSRRWTLWVSLAAVVLIVILQSVLWQGEPSPTATPIPPTAMTAESTGATLSFVPGTIAMDTPVLTPEAVLPGYDVAFMSRVDREAPWQIYVFNSRTGKRLRLTETNSNERTPRWSPDGRRLVFVSHRDGNREVYVMNLKDALRGADSSRLINLTRDEAPDWQPVWSPDGDRVAFSSYRDENWEIYVVHTDGTHLVRLTEHSESDFSPAWSPDGKKLLFVSRRHGDADLFIVDTGTGERTQLTEGKLDQYDPCWSPDGEWIAFVTQIGDQSDVFVMRADGSDPVNLTNSAYANDFQPTWAPDSEWLLFVSYTAAEGDHELYRMRRDGSEVTKLTDDHSDNLAPNWRPIAQ